MIIMAATLSLLHAGAVECSSSDSLSSPHIQSTTYSRFSWKSGNGVRLFGIYGNIQITWALSLPVCL